VGDSRVDGSPVQPGGRAVRMSLASPWDTLGTWVSHGAGSVAALACSLALGWALIAVTSGSPGKASNAYRELFIGSFGSWEAIQATLVQSIPYTCLGIAVALAFRLGIVNLGAPGQYYIAAIASTFVGYRMLEPGWLLLSICIAVGAAAGALWALIPAVLKAFRGVHEVITTMMLNYVAYDLLHFLLDGGFGNPAPMQGLVPGFNQSPDVNARFPVITPTSGTGYLALTLAFPLTLLLAVGFWFLIQRTTFGHAVRTVGANPEAARYAGIRLRYVTIIGFLLSGACVGLGAVGNVFGALGNLQDTSDGFTIGFAAIAVALIGRNTAFGCIVASILFGAFLQGSDLMQANAGVDANIIGVIEGLVILLIALEAMFKRLGVGLAPNLWLGRDSASAKIHS
jgi:ABC-type uncharacterized transport system permease subunit